MAEEKWIQKAVKHKGRVHRYLEHLYGHKAFKENGDIKVKYLNMAIRHVKRAKMPEHEKRSLLSALYLAKRLRHMHKHRKHHHHKK
ncbi:VP2-like protein [Sulfolobales Mexican fusellovirus 1]|uniref:VP2-like protein n=1 Tax=Sulfolobales Mexican fusellovirus 1 TaxID=1298531 RepID=UPI0002C115BF|nr:VP2-like protein [Sulfolobales Mexican fusellovirus 1]AGG36571.1 VP2-like protein [Sulfolobales Mexican fusellovirus 1]